MSKGSDTLLGIVKEIFLNQIIVLEHNIAEYGSLFLDIYLPQLLIAFEFDGEQHFTYSKYFHKYRQAFLESKKRDQAKESRCAQLGIKLIRVKFDEVITKDLVLAKIKAVLDRSDK